MKIDTQLQTSVGQSVAQDASLNALKSDAKMANDVKEIKKLSEQFESIFLEIVLKSMRDSVQKSEFMNGGSGEDIFRSMLDSEYAKNISQQRTTGLADSIERHLLGMMGGADLVKPNSDLNNQLGLQKYKNSK